LIVHASPIALPLGQIPRQKHSTPKANRFSHQTSEYLTDIQVVIVFTNIESIFGRHIVNIISKAGIPTKRMSQFGSAPHVKYFG